MHEFYFIVLGMDTNRPLISQAQLDLFLGKLCSYFLYHFSRKLMNCFKINRPRINDLISRKIWCVFVDIIKH